MQQGGRRRRALRRPVATRPRSCRRGLRRDRVRSRARGPRRRRRERVRASSAFQKRSKICVGSPARPSPVSSTAICDVSIRLGCDDDRDRSVGRGVAQRVREQVEQHALDLVGRDRHVGAAASIVDSSRTLRARASRIDGAEARVDDVAELRRSSSVSDAGVDARELEEIVDQEGEPSTCSPRTGRYSSGVQARPRAPRSSPSSPRRACVGRDSPRRRVGDAHRRPARRWRPSR